MTSWHDADAPVPVVFGAPDRQLSGLLHPTTGMPTGPGVVVATSIANEAVVSHRALRLLARTLARGGMPALLYDPPATGDSFGADDEPGRFATWRESFAWASSELAARTGARSVAVVGVRLGATLAVAAVDAGLDAAALVLWDPLSTGDEWLREERTYHLLARQIPADRAGPPPVDGGEELAGFLLSGPGVAELRAIDLLSGANGNAWREGLPVLIVEGARRRRRPLAEPLGERGALVESQKLPGLSEMLEEAERAEPPRVAIDAITEWLAARALQPASQVAATGAAPLAMLHDAGVHEQAFLVDGEAGRLFGITCEPTEQPPPRAWVVLLNAGFVRHIGPNRLYVRWAREWARRGLPSLRVDGRSVGESDGSDGPHRSVTELYNAGAVTDAASLVAALHKRRDVDALTLIGLCSGAYMAFHLALQAPAVKRIVLLNPQILSYDEDESQRGRVHYVRRSLLSAAKWRSMLARRSAPRQLVERVTLMARAAVAAAGRGLRRAPTADADWLVASLATLRDRGTEVHFVMSEGDPGLAYLARHLGPELRAAPKGSFELHLIRDADHTFRPLDAQRRLTPLVDRLVLGD